MNIYLDVVTPAQVYFFKNIISQLKKRGHNVQLSVHPKITALLLLNDLELQYSVVGVHHKRYFRKLIGLITNVKNSYDNMIYFNPNLVVGTIYAIYASKLLSIPAIKFEDDEVIRFQRLSRIPFLSAIITPEKFRKNFGEKHIRMKGYKELSYLHPKYFKPGKAILNDLGIEKDENYVIIRLNTWDAYHDIGRTGFSYKQVAKFIKEAKNYGRVFISTEKDLSKSLDKYKINIPFSKIHHVISHATLLVSDTQTMTTEAAVLGTPAIRCNSFVGPKDMSNFIELEQRYDLIFNYRDPERAIKKALELIQQPDLKREWAKKRERLLKDKIDVTAFMTWFIENYPESFEIMKENPEYQEKFK